MIGYAIHFANGLVFSLGYGSIFAAIDRAGGLLGAGLGAVHGAFVGGALMNVLLPAVHPRMGRPGRTPGRRRFSSLPASCS